MAQRTPDSFIVRQNGTRLGWGKMWDCKTSKMSQSPLAAFNAFGLFAAGALWESKVTRVPRVAAASIPTPFATSLEGDLSETR